jgi:hypothetical protein
MPFCETFVSLGTFASCADSLTLLSSLNFNEFSTHRNRNGLQILPGCLNRLRDYMERIENGREPKKRVEHYGNVNIISEDGILTHISISTYSRTIIRIGID